MKGFVLALLLANLLLFGWFSINRPPEQQAKPDAWDNSNGDQIATIVLLSEADQNPAARPNPEGNHLKESPVIEPPPLESQEEASRKESICLNVATFDAEEEAVDLQQRLEEVSLRSNIKIEDQFDKTDYRVTIEPADTFEAAQQLSRALLSKGYENYIIASGDQRNGISLGLFMELKRANTLKSEVEKANFKNVQIVETKKYKRTYTVFLEADALEVDESINQVTGMGLEKPETEPCNSNISPALPE